MSERFYNNLQSSRALDFSLPKPSLKQDEDVESALDANGSYQGNGKERIIQHSLLSNHISSFYKRSNSKSNSTVSYFIQNSAKSIESERFVSKIDALNDELLIQTFAFFQTRDLKNVSLVCRKWKDLAATHLWKRMVFPIDKRILPSMKPLLIANGRFVTTAMVVPPINMLTATALATGGLSIPITGSSSRNDSWSIPKPLSRSGSISSFSGTVPHSPRSTIPLNLAGSIKSPFLRHKPSINGEDKEFPKNYFINNEDSAINHGSRSAISGRDNNDDQSSFYSTFPYISDSDSVAQFGTPSRRNSSVLNYITSAKQDPSMSEDLEGHPYNLMELDLASTADSKILASSVTSSSIGPTVAIPIPGTPGAGNMLSTEFPSSPGSYFRSNGDICSTSNYSSSYIERNRFYSVSSGTIARLQQYLECYCPNITDLTVLNPNGITSHTKRMELLEQLFSTYPKLLRLNLSDFIMWDIEAMRLVAQRLHSLRSLNVTNRVEIRDEDLLSVIENCSMLEEIQVRATNISDVFIEAIEERLFSKLKVLDIGGCAVSSKTLSSLVKKAYNLVELRAWSCLRINDEFLLSLDSNFLSRLRILDLMDINGFSNDAIHKTFGQQKWQNLEYLRIRAKCSPESFCGLPKTSTLKLNPSSILD